MVCEEAGKGGEASEFWGLQWEEPIRRGEEVGRASWRWGRAGGEESCFLFVHLFFTKLSIYPIILLWGCDL